MVYTNLMMMHAQKRYHTITKEIRTILKRPPSTKSSTANKCSPKYEKPFKVFQVLYYFLAIAPKIKIRELTGSEMVPI